MPLDGTLYEDAILRVLSAAQERIRNPENWCKNRIYRQTADGTEQWCAVGAFYGGSSHDVPAFGLLDRAAGLMGYSSSVGGDLLKLNNTTDHPTVMAMFDRAQELRRAELHAKALVT